MSDIEEHFEREPEPQIDISSRVSSAPAATVELSRRADTIMGGLWASLFFTGRTAGNSLVLSSAAPREGVSTLACGLAIAGSNRSGGAGVALVDFNLRRPSVHKLLGIRHTGGLEEVLENRASPGSAAVQVNDNLHVFTSSGAGSRPLELLRGAAVKSFFQGLSEQYDNVIVDSAPVNRFPDAQVLAGIIGQAALVVHTNHTSREAVAQARKGLEAGGGKVVGAILNKRTYPIPGLLYNRL